MEREIVSDRQGIILIILFLMGSTLVVGTARETGRDVWIAILLAIFMTIPAILVYARLLYLFPGKDLFDILHLVFGKLIGRILGGLYVWFAFHLGAMIFRTLGEFIINVGLPETPSIVPMAIFALLCIWVVREGIEVMGRFGEFFLPIIIFLVVATTLLLLPQIDPKCIFPVMENGFRPVIEGAYSAFSFPFTEILVFLMAFGALKNSKSSYKIFLAGTLIGGAVILLSSMRDLTILGADAFMNSFFPSYTAVRRIDVGNFIQRLEILVSVAFIIGEFIEGSICLIAASKGVVKLFGFKDYRFIVVPVGLLMLNFSVLLYENIIEKTEWDRRVWPYYAFPFEVVLPIVILVAGEIHIKTTSEKGQA